MPAIPPGVRNAAIVGWGTALPETVVTNVDLTKTLDTSDEWIADRTGIRERRVGGTTAELSADAGRAAIESAGIDPAEIDALILATTTPDRTVPATSATVQNMLGLQCGAYDINAACSGWVYGLVQAHGLIAMGAESVLVIGTDTLSRITDWTDRGTAILFANGSGAAVVKANRTDIDPAEQGAMLGWDIDADGSAEDALYCEIGGLLQMEGREVFRRAVRLMVDSANKSLDAAGLTIDDLALVIPHQANIRIISAALDRLGIGLDQASVVLDRTGNTSAGSIPLALGAALDDDRIKEGDLVLFVGFGAGMTAASAVVRWGETGPAARGAK